MQGQNAPFRVKLPPKTEPRVYHARRPHRKSREGCAKCKQRRVKCDETRPRCQKCERLGLECTYEAILPPGCGQLLKQAESDEDVIKQFLDRIPSMTPDGTIHSLAVRAVALHLDELLQLKQGKFGECLSNMDVLRIFQDNITPTIISQAGQNVMRGKMIRLALQSPYLMHSIIAVAISRLRQTVPDTETSMTKYTLLEAHHWQRAIRQYSAELQSPITRENMDPLFSACLLMTVNSFGLETYNPRQSFVFSAQPAESLNWLFVQSGLRHLLGRAAQWSRKSIWWEMFMDSRHKSFEDQRTGREGLHPDLADLCGITEFSTFQNNPYLWPLRMLTPLLKLEPSAKTFPQITTFMGRLFPDYYERLIMKDPPALILLSWWLALMLSVDLWWVNVRARSECVAICMYLEDSDDPLILRLLEYPAQVSGYLLQHVQSDLAGMETSQSDFFPECLPLQPGDLDFAAYPVVADYPVGNAETFSMP
ncbi:Zn(II)2Cys6 transcription factor domain-containing protein [Aspergillus lucknowensis]|uniref:Zn(2)-C6 fungal-type domain-containing protein n=1 Tax=Aspergillus lucknowensis TaxID=176173 RepID=A0ABR4LK48_9EURO